MIYDFIIAFQRSYCKQEFCIYIDKTRKEITMNFRDMAGTKMNPGSSNSDVIFTHIRSFLFWRKKYHPWNRKSSEGDGTSFPHYYPDYNGLWTMIKGGKSTPDSKTIALRADIDALPVENIPVFLSAPESLASCMPRTRLPYCNVSLAASDCWWHRKEQLKGNVKIIFQVAEESCHGAQYYVEHGFLGDVQMPFTESTSGVIWRSLYEFWIRSAYGQLW